MCCRAALTLEPVRRKTCLGDSEARCTELNPSAGAQEYVAQCFLPSVNGNKQVTHVPYESADFPILIAELSFHYKAGLKKKPLKDCCDKQSPQGVGAWGGTPASPVPRRGEESEPGHQMGTSSASCGQRRVVGLESLPTACSGVCWGSTFLRCTSPVCLALAKCLPPALLPLLSNRQCK